MHIDRRRNDTVRKGHYPAFGRSKGPALDIVLQLRTWLRIAGLVVHPIGPRGPGQRLAAKYAPRCSRSRGARRAASRCGHGSAVLASASERLDSLGRRTGGERLYPLFGHLGAEGRHLCSNRGARRRGDPVPAKRPWSGSSGPRVHVPHVARSLSRNVRGLWVLTGPRSKHPRGARVAGQVNALWVPRSWRLAGCDHTTIWV